MKWEKKDIAPDQVKDIAAKYGCDLLTASVLARRGHCSGDSIRYFLEDDPRHLRNPFEMPGMEDAVERILAAKEKSEKVLVFGDSDVDGITGTALLAGYLAEIGMDVQWRIPAGGEAYGLSTEAVEKFAAADGTLVITVDCGISSNADIRRASELSVDVIVTDHHEPQEELPKALVIINPKLKNSPYLFRDLAGCGVAFKLVSALRFARKSKLYGQPVCLLNTRPLNEAWIVETVRMRNLVVIDTLIETIIPGMVSIGETRFPAFFEGQQILVWDAPLQKRTLAKLFGTDIEVDMQETALEIGREIPHVAGKSLLRLKEFSKTAKYAEKELTELDVFVNLFTSFVRIQEKMDSAEESADLQLAALGTIADVMPLLDENRIIVRNGIESLRAKPRAGLAELLYKLDLAGQRFGTKDISWAVSPTINAARRMGSPEKAAALFFEKDGAKRDKLAGELVALNDARKELEEKIWTFAEPMAYKSLADYDEKFVLVYGEEINKGIAGLIAQRIVKRFNVPAMAVSFNGENCTGSLRSARDYNVCALLEQCGDLFLEWGGHQASGGFSMKRENWDNLIERLKTVVCAIELAALEETLFVDAELPQQYLSPDTLNLVDRFEPYGKENTPLTFMAKNLAIKEINFIGKSESKHLKLTIDAGKYKWPALYWQAADRVTNKEFGLEDRVDMIFTLERNWFKGIATPQMKIIDLRLANG